MSNGTQAGDAGSARPWWRRLATARTARLLAVGYVVKTLLVGAAWLAVPDLGDRAVATARAAWERLAGVR